MTRPWPPHRAHGAAVAKEPRIVFCTWRTWPVPEQAGQVCADVPALAPAPWQVSQGSCRDRRSVLRTPNAASSSVISRS